MESTDPRRIDSLFKKGLPTISFEFFPPKTEAGFTTLFETIDELRQIKPSFVTVTYGAGGSTRGKTIELVERIQNELDLRSMAHLTCVGHSADEIGGIVDELWETGVRNIMALRGDPPSGQSQFTVTEGGFAYANELVEYIQGRHDFCIGVAGYPEGHPQCLNHVRDVENVKKKIDAGGTFVTSQLFFDNVDFYRFRGRCDQAGIHVPIIAGIMPIVNVAQIKRFVGMCGARIPHPLLTRLEAVEHDADAVYKVGVEHAIEQCQHLLAHNVEGIHFYTLNKSPSTVEVCKALNLEHPQ